MAHGAERGGSRTRGFMRENALTLLTVLGVVAGTALGLVLRSAGGGGSWSARSVMYLSFPGELFLRMLKALIVPLLVSSITTAIASLDLTLSKKIAIRATLYYMTTTICAVALGILLVVTIQPGVGATAKRSHIVIGDSRHVLTVDTLLDLVRNIFPPNMVQAGISSYRTKLVHDDTISGFNESDYRTWGIDHEYTGISNVLGLVSFSIVMGLVVGQMGEPAKPLLDFFNSLAEVMMKLTGYVIWLSPAGVFFLVTSKLLEISSFAEIVGQLGMYFCVVLLGLFIHGFGTLTIIFVATTRRSPFGYIAKMGQVIATAFGTGSSNATMPITIGWCDDMGLDPRITRFVIPIGATINMDGTALYEAVAAIFIAQMRKIPLTFGKIVAVSLTATAASIGAAGVPQAGLVTMVMVLDTVGLPADDIGIILAVDWLLDRFRTTINVMCDALGAIIVTKMSMGESDELQSERDLPLEPLELSEREKVNC